jgi:hypothetical protein
VKLLANNVLESRIARYNPVMIPELSNDIERAVEQNHGCLQVRGQRSEYVVMSIQAFRELMGVGSDAQLADSMDAVDQGLADVDAGRTQPVEAFFQEFDARHGIQR